MLYRILTKATNADCTICEDSDLCFKHSGLKCKYIQEHFWVVVCLTRYPEGGRGGADGCCAPPGIYNCHTLRATQMVSVCANFKFDLFMWLSVYKWMTLSVYEWMYTCCWLKGRMIIWHFYMSALKFMVTLLPRELPHFKSVFAYKRVHFLNLIVIFVSASITTIFLWPCSSTSPSGPSLPPQTPKFWIVKGGNLPREIVQIGIVWVGNVPWGVILEWAFQVGIAGVRWG